MLIVMSNLSSFELIPSLRNDGDGSSDGNFVVGNFVGNFIVGNCVDGFSFFVFSIYKIRVGPVLNGLSFFAFPISITRIG